MDRVAGFLSQKTPRRFLALAGFIGVLYLFRHLAILLVCFVTFERTLGFLARTIGRFTGLTKKRCVLVVVAVLAAILGVVAWLGIGKTVRTFADLHATLPDHLTRLREHPLVDRLEDQFGGMEKAVDSAKHYAGDALAAAATVGQFVIHAVMGFILALVFVLEEDELKAFWSRIDGRSWQGTLGRWLGHVADATIVTVQLQIIVAACNTALTLPVLLILGVPNVPALMVLIFVSALVPVIGNVVSGVILSLLAYQQKGWFGVGLFVGLTFLLHKVESYYLNPRLTARHVKIPGFLLIASLIACEHLFGFKGLFLSFPILFVAGRIRSEFVDEDTGTAHPAIDLSDSPAQLEARPSLAPEPTGMELERARIPFDSVRPDAQAGIVTPLAMPTATPTRTRTSHPPASLRTTRTSRPPPDLPQDPATSEDELPRPRKLSVRPPAVVPKLVNAEDD